MENNKIVSPHIARPMAASASFVVPAGQVARIWGIRQTGITVNTVPTITVNGKTMWWTQGSSAFLAGNRFGRLAGQTDRGPLPNDFLDIVPIVADEGQVVARNAVAGDLQLKYTLHSSRDEFNRMSDGGTEGKRRTIQSLAHQVTSILAGATTEVAITTGVNPAGETQFPWNIVAPPQKKFYLKALYIPVSNTVGTNLARTYLRMTLEGREILSVAGIDTVPGDIADYDNSTAYFVIFEEPIEIVSFQSLQLYMTIVSTDGGPQNATLIASMLFDEENLS